MDLSCLIMKHGHWCLHCGLLQLSDSIGLWLNSFSFVGVSFCQTFLCWTQLCDWEFHLACLIVSSLSFRLIDFVYILAVSLIWADVERWSVLLAFKFSSVHLSNGCPIPCVWSFSEGERWLKGIEWSRKAVQMILKDRFMLIVVLYCYWSQVTLKRMIGVILDRVRFKLIFIFFRLIVWSMVCCNTLIKMFFCIFSQSFGHTEIPEAGSLDYSIWSQFA